MNYQTPGTTGLHAKPHLWDSMSPGTFLFDMLITPRKPDWFNLFIKFPKGF